MRRRTSDELQRRRTLMGLFGAKKTPKQQMQQKVARNVQQRKLSNAMLRAEKADRAAAKARRRK